MRCSYGVIMYTTATAQPLKYRCTAAEYNGAVPFRYRTVPYGSTITIRVTGYRIPTKYLPGIYQVPNRYLPGTFKVPTRYLTGTYLVPTRYHTSKILTFVKP